MFKEAGQESSDRFFVRYAAAEDAGPLLLLMRLLARYEGYDHQFRVTEADLIERGFASDLPEFRAMVAESRQGKLLGYAVVYQVNFTFDLRPTLHMKELFVDEAARQLGVGKALLRAVRNDAKQHKCGCLKWDVLPDNLAAKSFYRKFNGKAVADWEAWHMAL